MPKPFKQFLLTHPQTNPPMQTLSYVDNQNVYQSGQSFLVPNMAAFIRDVTELGNIGAIKKRFFELNPVQMVILGLWNLPNLLKLARKDFATGVVLLVQMEILKVLPLKPKLIVLSDQITDLGVALNNPGIILQFFNLIQKRLGLSAGIMTNNLPMVARFLSNTKVNADYYFSPINREGYEMNPSQKKVEAILGCFEPHRLVAMIPQLGKNQKQYLSQLNIQAVLPFS